MKHLLSITDLNADEIHRLVNKAIELKRQRGRLSLLAGRTLALLFERPSLRTRVSFDVAMYQLGGHTIYLSPQEVGLGKREAVKDVAAVLCRYVDGVVTRVASQETLCLLAKHSTVPVINGLSEEEHPVQVLSDLLTIFEKKGRLAGLALAYVGDGNNVAHSLLLGACLMGLEVRLASPSGYQARPSIVSKARKLAQASGGRVLETEDPYQAVAGADVLYTDVWWSMGQEGEKEVRCRTFVPYQVNTSLVAAAKQDVIVMHNMPAHRGQEITDGVLDGPHSVVLDQAENRLHMQKAILGRLLG